MQVITIASPKGGVGKSTIAAALAVYAADRLKKRVALLDLNADQGSLTQWHVLRGEPANPYLVADVANIGQDIAVLKKAKQHDVAVIDTTPLDLDVIEAAVMVADVVLIPVRTSILDIGAVDSVVEMCRSRKKPFGFVLSAVDSKFKALTNTAVASLSAIAPVLGSRTSYRLPWINAMTVGKTGPEIDKDLAPEIEGLWNEAQRLISENARG